MPSRTREENCVGLDDRHARLVELLRTLESESKDVELGESGLRALLSAMSIYLGWPLAHAFTVDPAGDGLESTHLWYRALPGEYQQMVDATAGTRMPTDEGLVGKAMVARKPEWLELATEADFLRGHAAAACGLKTAVAVPVVGRSGVQAVLEFFSPNVEPRDEGALVALEHVGAAWGRVIETSATEHELRLLASATEHLREAIVISTAGDGGHGPTILYVNAAFTRITGYAESEILGKSFNAISGPMTDENSLQAMDQFMRAGETAAVEIVAHRKDGGEFLLAWQAAPISNQFDDSLNFVSILRDVTEERSVQQALSRADRDALTGLPNRDVLEKRLRRSIERAKERDDYRYAVLFIDLDGFKKVNDDFGHVVGDQLLNSAAERLERTVRPGDTLARFGGDEFVILLEYVTGIADVVMVADRVQRRLEAPFKLQGREHRVAASIGVALSETGYKDARDAIRDADRAMYEAKRKGKGRFEFSDQSLYTDVVAVLSLQEDLKRCLDRDELELHYQPLVDLASQSIIGFEALVRWRHPELGLLLPDQFIHLAEESGVIVPLGRWVMRTACVDAQSWQQTQLSGDPLVLSVNVSMRELKSADFVEGVATILRETGIAPERVQLELTESVFMDTLEPVRSRIVAVRRLGVTVCIDDFGTGYSSLGHLHRLPIDKIKIDRLFVRHLDEAPGNREILRTILSLARHLGLDVVAEGVESNAQLMTLRELACAYGQGFLFSKPVPLHRLVDLFVGDAPDDAAFAVG